MEKSNMRKMVWQIIFFGAVWGAVEATLGYLLHFLPPLISGMVMFPIAVFILMKACRATGSRTALIFVGFIAAGIKAVDFALPGMMVFKTINPMISIVLESLVVAAAYPLLSGAKAGKRLLGAFGTSLGWRSGYILYMVGQFLITGHATKYITSPGLTAEFIVLYGLLSGVIVYGALAVDKATVARTIRFRPAYAVAALALALGIQLIL